LLSVLATLSFLRNVELQLPEYDSKHTCHITLTLFRSLLYFAFIRRVWALLLKLTHLDFTFRPTSPITHTLTHPHSQQQRPLEGCYSIASSKQAMERFQPKSWPTGVEESVLGQKKVSYRIPVHAEYRRATHRREGAILIDSIYNDTGCIVVTYWDQSTIRRFDVYAGAGSKSAVAAVNKWIARGGRKSKESSVWANTPAFKQDQWCQDQLELREEETMELFLGPIPNMQEGEAIRPKVNSVQSYYDNTS
jgi:hypothetical protein